MHHFEDQWAVILGGSSGLGLASARKLASAGMNLCILHRDRRNRLPDFEKEIDKMRSFGVQIKTYNKNALIPGVREEILAGLPAEKVHLLLHSIAKGSVKKIYDENQPQLSRTDLDLTLDAMALSWYDWSAALVKHNLFSPNARNLAFTSEGNSRVWPGYAAVAAAKSALESLMRSMAVEWAPLGIRTNCIQAGTTRTPSFKIIPESEKLAQAAVQRNPFGRLTTAEDIANIVYLMILDEAAWINGTVIKADGGESLR